MAYRDPDTNQIESILSGILSEIHSPYNDGFVQRSCKHKLYMLKCWLEDEYAKLPTFTGEDKWEQERVIQILKKQ
jgi:hypothetical protein